jgi:hypothetical protein
MAASVVARDMAGAAEPSFDRFAGVCAIIAGAASFLYSIAFVVLKEVTLYSILQLVGALASSAVLVALYMRLRSADPGLSLWALLLAVTAALGSAIHAAYDLANAANPPKADVLDQNNLPNLVDLARGPWVCTRRVPAGHLAGAAHHPRREEPGDTRPGGIGGFHPQPRLVHLGGSHSLARQVGHGRKRR